MAANSAITAAAVTTQTVTLTTAGWDATAKTQTAAHVTIQGATLL